MGRPFWTTGPVPLALLQGLALPRPDATATLTATLREGRPATLGGTPGSGRSTLGLQVAAALDAPALRVDAASLTGPADEATLDAVAESLGRRRLTWDQVPAAVERAGRPIVILDGHADELVRRLPRLRGVRTLTIGAKGTAPDPIRDTTAMAFLQRRSQTVGVAWTTEALAQAARLADGHVDVLQWIGQSTLAEALMAGDAQVRLETVLEGAAVAADHLPIHLSVPLARVRGAQYDLLRAVARRPDATGTEWGRMADVEANAVAVHLGRLCRSGLLARHGRGRYAIANPLLRLHLQARHANVAQLLRAATST
jgi:hypothetical protein